MIQFVEFNVLILIIYWILSFSQFHFISGAKPRCVGNPLTPDEFSSEEDVGFVRDICVDVVARVLYNASKYPVSKLCEDLANKRTSTCICKCSKWKRSSFWNEGATNEVMSMAEALMENLIKVFSKDRSRIHIDKEFMFVLIVGAKRRLIDSGAATKDSKIVDQLQTLKKYFAPRDELYQNQVEYEESIGKYTPLAMKKLGELLAKRDLEFAVKQFIKTFRASHRNEIRVPYYYIEKNFVEEATMSGIIRLKFEYKKGKDTNSSSVILKIPSLAPFYHERYEKLNIYDREIYFYETLLPALYEMGKCEPFAPKLYTATQEKALVLEDLSIDGYKRIDQFVFFDLDHSRICLTVLAKYHALSYKYIRSLNKDDSNMSLINSVQFGMRKVTNKIEFDTLCETVKPHLSSPLYEKILNMAPEILAVLPTINNLDENSMTVIIHADFQERNILFKYDANGKVSQVKIIDWQMCREASPILDLINFIVPNISFEVFEANGDHLLKSYLDTLNHYLSVTSTNRVYNRLEFDRDIAFFKYYYFRSLSIFATDVEQLEESKRQPFQSHIAQWVMYLEKKGLI